MDLRIEIADEREVVLLRELKMWLDRSSTLDGSVVQLVEAPIEPGRMGGVVEAVRVVLTSKEAIAPALTAVGGWIVARAGRSTKVKVRVGDREAEITAPGRRDPGEIARELLDALGVDHES
ncbi:effector-associated constant component EACC1 [Dactylosporangium sp. McL0621]|uniref:effector-associated constant component EACC1 n=1 Tax=Dactylosporangium sp. McL0621 TaxID=3415678 RepID=UPI003CEC72C0